MAIDIDQYRDHIHQELLKLDQRSRVCFTAWCCERLLRECEQFLGKRVPEIYAPRLVLDQVRELNMGASRNAAWLGRFLECYRTIHWDEPVELEAIHANFAAIEALEAFSCLIETLNGQSDGAEAAIRLLNLVDYRLGHILGAADSMGHPAIAMEIDHQEKFLASLQGGEPERLVFPPIPV